MTRKVKWIFMVHFSFSFKMFLSNLFYVSNVYLFHNVFQYMVLDTHMSMYIVWRHTVHMSDMFLHSDMDCLQSMDQLEKRL